MLWSKTILFSLCFTELGTMWVLIMQIVRRVFFRHSETLWWITSRIIEICQNWRNERPIVNVWFKDDEFEIQLSFNSNAKFSCLADVLDIKRDEQSSWHAVADQDIDKNNSDWTMFLVTWLCLRSSTYVMFCSGRYWNQNDIHGEICGATRNHMPLDIRVSFDWYKRISKCSWNDEFRWWDISGSLQSHTRRNQRLTIKRPIIFSKF